MWLWIFIPNQQRFSFHWVFKEAIPSLVPKWLRDRVLFIMKDADPQQRNEIQSAMMNIFVNASEGTCWYHLVNMGWKNNLPTCINIFTPSKQNRWSVIVHQIHTWIYSWMNPGNVEDEDEYKISSSSSAPMLCWMLLVNIISL